MKQRELEGVWGELEAKYCFQRQLKNFIFLFMSLLRHPIFKNDHFVAEIDFIYLKTSPRSNYKGFQYQSWTSVKRSEKQLSSKTNFNMFLQISYSTFKLKLCEMPQSYQNWETYQVQMHPVQVRSKILFPETIFAKIYEINLSVSVKQLSAGKVQLQYLNIFLLVLTKFSFWDEDRALGYNSMKILDLLNIS